MKQDAKTVYAQSSDIKSRTYLEYRRDMKRKAIFELEALEWLDKKMKKLYPDKKVKVYKSGGDKFLWFLRKGGLSRQPDFIVKIYQDEKNIEFQYVNAASDEFYFNFKKGKLLDRKNRMKNTIFFILLSGSPNKYAFLTSEWILNNSKYTFEPAWRVNVYRVLGKDIILKEDDTLLELWDYINAKNNILDFQHHLINDIKDNLSYLLQNVIDQERVVNIIPNDLESYFHICFILDNIQRIPNNISLWLIYLLTFINNRSKLKDINKIFYCVDYLYSKTQLKINELKLLILKIKETLELLKLYSRTDGHYQSDVTESPLIETKYALFSINIIEDLIQDMIYYYNINDFKAIRKIYENVDNVITTSQWINKARNK